MKKIFVVVFSGWTTENTIHVVADDISQVVAAFRNGVFVTNSEGGEEAASLKSVSRIGEVNLIGEMRGGVPVRNIRNTDPA